MSKKLIIEYDPILGDVEPDALIAGYINRLIHTFDYETEDTLHRIIASEIIISGIRVAIKQKRLDYNEVVFRFKKEDIYPTAKGRLQSWPSGFCDHWDNYLTELIDL